MTNDDPDGWRLTGSDGELLIRTGVAGPAAAMGHRLTLAMRRWQVITDWRADEPVSAELTVEVGSLAVVRGEGGVTPLSGAEKMLVRSNALRSMNVRKYPRIAFSTNQIDRRPGGYLLSGELEIHGQVRPQIVDLSIDGSEHSWQLSSETVVRQSDFGIKPYSQLLGALKVADDVTVSFTARRVKRR